MSLIIPVYVKAKRQPIQEMPYKTAFAMVNSIEDDLVDLTWLGKRWDNHECGSVLNFHFCDYDLYQNERKMSSCQLRTNLFDSATEEEYNEWYLSKD